MCKTSAVRTLIIKSSGGKSLRLVLIALAFLFYINTSVAATLCSADLCKVDPAADVEISKFSVCKVISNAGSTAIMVPAKTVDQLNSFINAPTKPAGVTLTTCLPDCTCPDSSTVKLGQACSGGGICAGVFKGTNRMILPGGCHTTSNPTCTGCDGYDSCGGSENWFSKVWRGSGGTNTDIPNVTNVASDSTVATQDGNLATAEIVAHASNGSDSSAKFCDNMVFGGYSDWYLPSKSELTYLYCNSTFSGVRDTGYPQEQPNCAGDYNGPNAAFTGFHPSATYTTSTENNSSNVWTIYFSNLPSNNSGLISINGKVSSGKIRCMRKY